MSNKANVVLIYPKIGGPFVSLRKKRPMPLGLLNASVYLVDDYEVKIFDQAMHSNWKAALTNIINSNTLIVGIHAMAGYQLLHALEVSEFVKSTCNVLIIWGGVHPSLIPETVLKERFVDYVCVGEGERTFSELVKAIQSKKDISSVKGIYYREDNKNIFTGERAVVDLNDLPELPYHLLHVSAYNVSGGTRFDKNEMKLAIETSRGCCNDCIFCYNPVFHKRKWRAQDAKRVIERIEYLVKNYHVTYLDFIDDAFFTDLGRVEKIAKLLIARKINIKWFLQGVDIHKLMQADDAYLNLLDKAGCRVMRMGAESGSARILKEMRKKSSIDEVLKINKRLRTTNIVCYYYFTIGMPGETEEDLKETVDLMLTLLADNPQARIMSAFCLTPQPGTRLLELAQKDGFSLPKSVKEWTKIDGTTIITPWFDERMKKKLNFLFFTSLFIDKKNQDIIDSAFIRFLCVLYRPIALYRTRHLNFKFPLEYAMFNSLKKKF
ncbi:MAG: B12-binding domain-containing radical SAM protein [Candidatus Omnitrophica bacterium]|nr:B12-binding domain-containing radical SAM protein [Candidatus Omnitrophota bacterium]